MSDKLSAEEIKLAEIDLDSAQRTAGRPFPHIQKLIEYASQPSLTDSEIEKKAEEACPKAPIELDSLESIAWEIGWIAGYKSAVSAPQLPLEDSEYQKMLRDAYEWWHYEISKKENDRLFKKYYPNETCDYPRFFMDTDKLRIYCAENGIKYPDGNDWLWKLVNEWDEYRNNNSRLISKRELFNEFINQHK